MLYFFFARLVQKISKWATVDVFTAATICGWVKGIPSGKLTVCELEHGQVIVDLALKIGGFP